MRDPMRLEEGAGTAFERRLFDAAKRQVPGPVLKARMEQGLGLSGAAVPVPSMVVKTFALGGRAKLLLAVVAVAAAVTGPLVWRTRRGAPSLTNDGHSRTNDGHSRSVTPSSAPAAHPTGTLLEEIRLLDRARGAMSTGEPRRALVELKRYAQQYPRGVFSPEATALRVEAMDAVGDTRAAKALGEQFLAQHPNNPLADRVSRIVRP